MHHDCAGKFFNDVTETVQELEIYETKPDPEKIFGRKKEYWEKEVESMSDGSFSIQLKNGERLNQGDDTHMLRLKIGA